MATHMIKKAKKSGSQKTSSANFWAELPRPFFILAPMANVTDSVFRKLFAKYGKPDVTYTEFVSADGLLSVGKDKLLVDLKYTKAERPIVAQLFTGHPEAMKGAAALVADLKFDGLDINMGCPDRAVEKQGGGASLIRNPERAVAVLSAARAGAPSLPVSVKTRLGYNAVDWNWIRAILGEKPPVLIVHLRTRKEMSEVAAHWELMPEVIRLRNEISPETLIVGNGDVLSIEEGRQKCAQYGCDGVMIGRGAFGKPWLFAQARNSKSQAPNSKQIPNSKHQIPNFQDPKERLKVLLEHTKAFEKAFQGIKSFETMKKHFKAYVSGWDGAKELRAQLMETHSAKEVAKVIKAYIAK